MKFIKSLQIGVWCEDRFFRPKRMCQVGAFTPVDSTSPDQGFFQLGTREVSINSDVAGRIDQLQNSTVEGIRSEMRNWVMNVWQLEMDKFLRECGLDGQGNGEDFQSYGPEGAVGFNYSLESVRGAMRRSFDASLAYLTKIGYLEEVSALFDGPLKAFFDADTGLIDQQLNEEADYGVEGREKRRVSLVELLVAASEQMRILQKNNGGLIEEVERIKKELVRYKLEIARYGLPDSLTGLYQKQAYSNYMYDLVKELKDGERENVHVLGLDLDHFKRTNDAGVLILDKEVVEEGDSDYIKLEKHDVGDKVLQLVADTLREVVGDKGKVFRLGGEEINIVLYDLSDEEVVEFSKRMHEELYKIEWHRDIDFENGVNWRHLNRSSDRSSLMLGCKPDAYKHDPETGDMVHVYGITASVGWQKVSAEDGLFKEILEEGKNHSLETDLSFWANSLRTGAKRIDDESGEMVSIDIDPSVVYAIGKVHGLADRGMYQIKKNENRQLKLARNGTYANHLGMVVARSEAAREQYEADLKYMARKAGPTVSMESAPALG